MATYASVIMAIGTKPVACPSMMALVNGEVAGIMPAV